MSTIGASEYTYQPLQDWAKVPEGWELVDVSGVAGHIRCWSSTLGGTWFATGATASSTTARTVSTPRPTGSSGPSTTTSTASRNTHQSASWSSPSVESMTRRPSGVDAPSI